MNADWYVDPLDRFDGRFFDGERWTEQVSQDGKMVIDPDFAPVDAELENEPMVARRTVRPGLPAADIAESPVRTVAVLDRGTGRQPDGDGSSRRYLVWGLLGLAAVLAVVVGVILGGRDDDSSAEAEPVELDSQDVARVQDLESGGADELIDDTADEAEVGAPEAAVPEGATFDADELIEVGALRIVNGVSLLQDLEEWHRGYAEERRIVLGSDAKCWFGRLGGAAVQMAHCGPVGATDDGDFLYDLVPLVFEDVEGGQIARPVVDAATPNAVLADALTLIGN